MRNQLNAAKFDKKNSTYTHFLCLTKKTTHEYKTYINASAKTCMRFFHTVCIPSIFLYLNPK